MDVAIIMGSVNDGVTIKPAFDWLDHWGVECEMRVLSAHRTPSELQGYINHCEQIGVKVYIAAAGMAAHLAGAIAARTIRPVIAIPMDGKMSGLDSLLSSVQMPPGVPVATVGVGMAKNAALLAAQILAISSPDIKTRLTQYRVSMRDEILNNNLYNLTSMKSG